MGTPAFLYLIVASQGLPVIAVLAVGGRHPSIPHYRLALLCCTMLISDLIMRVVAVTTGPNHWVSWFMQPLEVALTLWLLSEWQVSARSKALYLHAILIGAVVTLVLLVLTNPADSFDKWISSSQALIALSAVLHTAVVRTLESRERLTDQEWFWICSGLALLWVSYVPVFPFVDAVLGTHTEMARSALLLRASLIPAAFSLMTWGVMCRRKFPASSGRL